jgi:magnesium chelatase subunit I
MSIANLENVVSNAERRSLLTGERWIVPRVSDLFHIIPSSRGKIELAMSEGDGHEDRVLGRIVEEAVKNIFDSRLNVKEFRSVVDHFESGGGLELIDTINSRDLLARIDRIPGLRRKSEEIAADWFNLSGGDADVREAAVASVAEFILEGLYVHNKLNKTQKSSSSVYKR